MLRTLPTYVYLLAIVLLLAANVILYRALAASEHLRIDVFETGKGTAALVRTPEGKTLLVDTGPDARILRDLGRTLPEWQHRIDTLILTSDRRAQIGGTSYVLDRYRVGDTVHADADTTIPYGSLLRSGNLSVIVIGPGRFNIVFGESSFHVSSSTQKGRYVW